MYKYTANKILSRVESDSHIAFWYNVVKKMGLCRENDFYNWLKNKSGKSMAESTISKYTRAINSISEEMLGLNVIERH